MFLKPFIRATAQRFESVLKLRSPVSNWESLQGDPSGIRMVKTYIWDVPSHCLVSYSGSPPAARAMVTKSTGGFNHPEGYPVSGIINNLGCTGTL